MSQYPFAFLPWGVSSGHALSEKGCPSDSALQCLFCPQVLGCTEMEMHRKAQCCSLWCTCFSITHAQLCLLLWMVLRTDCLYNCSQQYFFSKVMMIVINKPERDATLSPQVVLFLLLIAEVQSSLLRFVTQGTFCSRWKYRLAVSCFVYGCRELDGWLEHLFIFSTCSLPLKLQAWVLLFVRF